MLTLQDHRDHGGSAEDEDRILEAMDGLWTRMRTEEQREANVFAAALGAVVREGEAHG